MNNFNDSFSACNIQAQAGPINCQYQPTFPVTDNVNYPPYVEQNSLPTSTEPWIDAWLLKIRKNIPIPKVSTKKSNTSISTARKSFKSCLDILTQLTAISEDLKANFQNLSSADWKKKTEKIGQLKENFLRAMNELGNPDNVANLQKAISLREKKRAKIKRKNISKQAELKKELEERRNINKRIDRWLEVEKEEDNKVKMEETMKKDIDCVLAEVNKKKSDAKKNLQLINALIKLRQVRETMYTQRGEKTSLQDKQAFAITTEKMLRIWNNALKQYNEEEHMLKTMLEKTASDNLKHQELLKEKETLFSWEKIIFGQKVVPSPENASLWALTAAERDTETFIAIRKSWDTFLVPQPQGSSIPIGWVLPPNEPNKGWEKFLS